MSKVNIAEKFSKITEYWKPYISAELNGQHVKIGRSRSSRASTSFIITSTKTECSWWSKGACAWSSVIATRGSREGEFIVAPRGVERRAVAE
jgi:hypothetical protein